MIRASLIVIAGLIVVILLLSLALFDAKQNQISDEKQTAIMLEMASMDLQIVRRKEKIDSLIGYHIQQFTRSIDSFDRTQQVRFLYQSKWHHEEAERLMKIAKQ